MKCDKKPKFNYARNNCICFYWDNDGTYSNDDIYTPIFINDIPIGFIESVNENIVTAFIWKRYANKIVSRNIYNGTETTSIEIKTKKEG